MEYEDAKELLPKFWHLMGTVSKRFGQEITDIFIGYEDAILTQQMHWWCKRVENFQYLPSDKGKYTICVELQHGNLFSIKNIVEQDNLVDLIPLVQSLHYMRELIYGSVREQDYERLT